MNDSQTQPWTHRLYGELAGWWPLISPPEEYDEEATFAATLLSSAAIAVNEILELGSGGGHNAVHLKASFAMTLVDLSEDMLEVSRRLNPECEHRCGDMRTIRLDRGFDAVFVHDAVDYMTTESDLRRAVETAFAHCRPGGVAVFIPDETKESFEESSDHGGNDGHDGRGVRYLEWSWDPNPHDTWTLTEYAFLLRGLDSSVQAVHETHRLGLFGREDWHRLLAAAGFVPSAVTEVTSEDRSPRECFVGHRPLETQDARPGRVLRALPHGQIDRPARGFARVLGARDVAQAALIARRPTRGWILTGAVVDATQMRGLTSTR